MVAEIEQKALKFLYPFTPLMQIWAGIFLSILFDKILENSPVYKLFESLHDKRFKPILNKLQATYDEQSLRCAASGKWNLFIVPRVNHIAVVTFCYSLCLLLVIGLGQNYSRTPLVYLLSAATFIIIYDLVCSLVNVKCLNFDAKYFYVFILIIILFLYFLCFHWLEGWIIGTLNLDKTFIGWSALFIPLFSVFIVFLLVPINFNKETKELKRKLERYSENQDALINVVFDFKNVDSLPQDLKNAFLKRIASVSGNGPTDTLKLFYDFIEDEKQKLKDEIEEEIRNAFPEID